MFSKTRAKYKIIITLLFVLIKRIVAFNNIKRFFIVTKDITFIVHCKFLMVSKEEEEEEEVLIDENDGEKMKAANIVDVVVNNTYINDTTKAEEEEEEEEEEDDEEDLLPESFGQHRKKKESNNNNNNNSINSIKEPKVDIAELAKNDFRLENLMNKNLIVIDLNGLLMQRSFTPLEPSKNGYKIEHDAKVGNFYVYNRPYMKEFIDFLHENFTVGVWSSATEYNARMLVRHLWGKKKEKQLAFVWGQEKCTNVGVFTEPRPKPVFLKEIEKIWSHNEEMEKFRNGYTLLVDDSPYKAVNNPTHSAIHPAEFNILFKDVDITKNEWISADEKEIITEVKQVKGIKRKTGIAPKLGKKRMKQFITQTRTSSTFDKLVGNDFDRFLVNCDDELAPNGELREYLEKLAKNDKGSYDFVEKMHYGGKIAPLGPVEIVRDMVSKAKEIEKNIANGIVLASEMKKTIDATEICLDDL